MEPNKRKEVCPYSLKEITPETKITFGCKHSYHKSIFEVINIDTFKCGVSGCRNSEQFATQIEFTEDIQSAIIEIEDEPEEITQHDISHHLNQPDETKETTQITLTSRNINELTDLFKEEMIKYATGDTKGLLSFIYHLETHVLGKEPPKKIQKQQKMRYPPICSKCKKPMKGNHKKMIIDTQIQMVCK